MELTKRLKESLQNNQMARKSGTRAKSMFWYGAICALAFSGNVEDAKQLAVDMGVNIDRMFIS